MAEQLCQLKKKGGSSGGTAELNQMIKLSANAANALTGKIELDIAMLKACGYSKFGIQGSAYGLTLDLGYRIDNGTLISMRSGTMYTIPNGTKLKIEVSVRSTQSTYYLAFNDFVLLFE